MERRTNQNEKPKAPLYMAVKRCLAWVPGRKPGEMNDLYTASPQAQLLTVKKT